MLDVHRFPFLYLNVSDIKYGLPLLYGAQCQNSMLSCWTDITLCMTLFYLVYFNFSTNFCKASLLYYQY